MLKWRKKLGWIAGGLVSLGGLVNPAQAQYPGNIQQVSGCAPAPNFITQPPPPGAVAAGGAQAGSTGGPPTLPNDGSPNAFSDLYDPCHWTRPLFWFAGDGMVGFIRHSPPSIPLITTSTNPSGADFGLLGQPSTVVLNSPGGVDLPRPAGFQASFGFSPTCDWRVPFEVVYTYLHAKNTVFAGASDANGNPLLARPVLSTTPGSEGEVVDIASFPGLRQGSVEVDSSVQFWGIQGVGVIRTEMQWGNDASGFAVSLPLGFRYLNLSDGVNITSTAQPLDPAIVHFLGATYGPGSETIVTDVFKGHNEFRGVEFGARFETRVNRFFMTLEPRVSLGSTNQNIIILGTSTLEQTGLAAQTAPGGLLALPTNPSHSRERFTYVPEGTATIGWDLFGWMRLQAGYNITYWPNVVRAGDQINRSVDLRQVPTSPNYVSGVTYNSPLPTFNESSFLLQGVTLGVIFSF